MVCFIEAAAAAPQCLLKLSGSITDTIVATVTYIIIINSN